MAPMGESCYFPPLDRCLDGRHQLFSWKTTYVGLSQLGDIADNGSLQKHVTDHLTLDLLTQPFFPYSAPTSHTKSNFETKTSAINVPPSAQGRYDIKQIREDAIWLSKETNISEIEALRIAVLEWQTRPAQRLLQESPQEAVNVQSSVGIGGHAGSLRSSILSQPPASESDASNAFDSSDARRQRLLLIYLSERRYILRTSEYVVFAALFQTSLSTESTPSSMSKGRAPDRPWLQEESFPRSRSMGKAGWVEEVGNRVSTHWNLDGHVEGSNKNFVVSAVDALESRIKNLEEGSGWFQEEGSPENIEAAWAKNQILEMIHIMQMILTLLDSATKLTRTDALMAWFRFVHRCMFFQRFELSGYGIQDHLKMPLQSLVTLVSLSLLNVQKSLEIISEISAAITLAENPTDAVPYLLNIGAITETNDILLEAGAAALTNASPAVLAWGIILQTIREHALLFRESREVKQSQRAADRYGVADHSDTDGVERSSARGNSSRQRRSSTSSETSQQISFLEEILDSVTDITLPHDTIEFLATAAVDKGHVFDVVMALATDYCTTFGSDHNGKFGLKIRRILLELIQAVLQWIEYQPILILATLAILTGNESYWDTWDRPRGFDDAEPAAFFIVNSSLMQNLFQTALSRFPYEALPFIKLSRALAIYNVEHDQGLPAIWPLFQKLESLTCLMPIDFTQYEIIHEEDDTNYIQLTGNLSFVNDGSRFTSTQPNKSSKPSRDLIKSTPLSDYQQVPSGTIGRVLSESKPLIVLWRYDYSPLAYLGRILRSFSVDAAFSTVTSDLRDTVSEAIDLLTAMISAAARRALETEASNAQNAAQTILENASDGLDRNEDVISVIFQIFENEMHRSRDASEEEGSLDILIRCIQFTHAILPVIPGRVWPFLGRSSLLGINGSQSQLNAIIASAEMVSGKYDFLLGCIRVFESLVEDAIAHAISHRVPTTAVKRFADPDNLGTGVSQLAMEKVIINFQRIMVDVFESTRNWKFTVPEEKIEINTWVCLIFNKILAYCFHIDGQSTTSQNLAGTLAPAADYLLNAFLSTSHSNLTLNPLLQILIEGAATPNDSLSIRGLQIWTSQVRVAIQFTTGLIRVNGFLKRPRSHLQQELFKASPILAKVYAAHESYRLPIVELFDALIRSIDKEDPQPPSLLGHLGQHTASSFLEVLSVTDQPFSDDDLSIEIWRLLSAIVSRRQQWFAIFILTGNTPRESFQDIEKTNSLVTQRAEPLLTIALDSLSNMEKLGPMNAIAMLEFIASAADYWPWVINKLGEHPHFIAAVTEYLQVHSSSASPTKVRASQAPADYIRFQMSSVILEILAMYVNNTQQTGNAAFAKKLLPSLTSYTEQAVSLPGYNASLHGNLRRNFESKFPGCSVAAFKRTEVNKGPLGRLFYYDLDIAEKMLAFDPAWKGRRGQGFADEMSRANDNFSLIESQMNLLRSWKFLVVELSGILASDAKFQSLMILTVVICLRSNASSSSPEAIFEQLAMSRAELAFTLLQDLIESKSSNNKLKDILSTTWDTFRAHGTDVGLALAGESADYYRLLLKTLCLALQAHVPDSESNDANAETNTSVPLLTTQLVLEILEVVVARGFRSLTALLHDDPTRILPADFFLIVALLRTGLRIPDIEKQSTQLVTQFSDNQTARCASALLSWADQIVTDHDPVYGELSIMFLLELSSIPALAESLAVEGILAQVSSTNLIIYLRQDKGVGPFDSPSRLYSIWARGLLPLLLNLLHAIGAPVAAEIAASLNSFSGQLTRASDTFLGKSKTSADPTAGAITLSMVSEAQTLAVITSILDTFREAGPSAGVIATHIQEPTWDKVQVKGGIENLLQRRTTLRDRILPSNEKEEAWVRQPPVSSAGGAENRLEEKIVRELSTTLSILGGGEQ